MEETFVSFETAKLLKKAGFPQYRDEGGKYYTEEGRTRTIYHEDYEDFYGNVHTKIHDEGNVCVCPTQAQAMQWFRKRDIIINFHLGKFGEGGKIAYELEVCRITGNGYYLDKISTEGVTHYGDGDCDVIDLRLDIFPTYEQTMEAGIQAACYYLIDY